MSTATENSRCSRSRMGTVQPTPVGGTLRKVVKTYPDGNSALRGVPLQVQLGNGLWS